MNKQLHSLFIFAILLVFMGSQIHAQVITSKIRGTVQDALTNQPLIGAEVFALVDSTVVGTVTDLDGNFTLAPIPVGRHSVFVRYLGYEDASARSLLVTTGVSKEVVISMQESVQALDVVEVVARKHKGETVNSNALVSTRSFSVEEASRFAGSFNDPARMAQSFAGVANGDDENNEIIIRGNSPRGVLWRLEGLEIPNPNHYRSGEGGSGGAISMITDQVLANSDFFTGAFPAAYGNALSGVFDLRFRNGNTDKHKFSLQAGVLGLQVGAEGPIGSDKKASYLINYRYSTVTILEKIGIEFSDENEITPVFQDLSFKINIPGKGGNRWTIYGLGGRSIAGSNPQRDSTQWQDFNDRTYYDETYTTGIIGISNTQLFKNQKTSWKNSLSYNYQADLYEDFIIQPGRSDRLWEDSEFT
nr:TonB-dependent receptor [Saprospiraceae bacterium]